MENKISFDEFTQAVVEKIREYLPETFATASVELSTVLKNNDMRLTGLTIRSVDNNVSPTIYLEQFFDRYQDGEDMSRVLKRIAELRLSHEVNDRFDTEQITAFERVKDKIVPKLINKAWNEELLKVRVHTDMGDLAVTYQILLQQGFTGNASIGITKDIFRMWDMDIEELHKLALKNMRNLSPSTFEPMSAVLTALMDEETAELFSREKPMEEVMWVLSNRDRINGATAVLDTEIMKTISDTLGDFIILPSSVHELIIVKASADMNAEMLEQMIKQVNSEQVSPDERLSDHPYVWSEECLLPV